MTAEQDGVPELGKRRASGVKLEEGERAAGLRCDACGRRIHNGFRGTTFLERLDPERGAIVVTVNTANVCVRDDCSGVDEVQKTGIALEKIEVIWLDELRGEAEPSARTGLADPPAKAPPEPEARPAG